MKPAIATVFAFISARSVAGRRASGGAERHLAGVLYLTFPEDVQHPTIFTQEGYSDRFDAALRETIARARSRRAT